MTNLVPAATRVSRSLAASAALHTTASRGHLVVGVLDFGEKADKACKWRPSADTMIDFLMQRVSVITVAITASP